MNREPLSNAMPSPGPFGRFIRIVLGLGAFYFFWVNRHLLHLGASMTATYWMNWIAVSIGFFGTWTVLTRLIRLPRNMGTKTLIGAIYGGSAVFDIVSGNGFPGPVFTFVAFGALLLFFLILGFSFFLQAILATPA